MACTLARPVEQGLAYRVTVRGRNWTGSAVKRASVADDRPWRMGSAVTDPRGFQGFGRSLERLLDSGRRLRRSRP
jgi:hypothetical protein